MAIDLSRFIAAQQDTYAAALAELRFGRKRGHWMWFIFPQLRGLGRSETAKFFGLADLAEAVAYIQHPILGKRLVECTTVVYGLANVSLQTLFGYPDDMKFISCMTLFSSVEHAPAIFRQALLKFNEGIPDPLTLDLIHNGAKP
jgi:uncharacterized protein (DUF1810 family)